MFCYFWFCHVDTSRQLPLAAVEAFTGIQVRSVPSAGPQEMEELSVAGGEVAIRQEEKERAVWPTAAELDEARAKLESISHLRQFDSVSLFLLELFYCVVSSWIIF